MSAVGGANSMHQKHKEAVSKHRETMYNYRGNIQNNGDIESRGEVWNNIGEALIHMMYHMPRGQRVSICLSWQMVLLVVQSQEQYVYFVVL